MFNEIADKIKHAPTVEEKKKWVECAYVIAECRTRSEMYCSKKTAFLDYDEANEELKEMITQCEEMYARSGLEYSDVKYVSLVKVEYYCGNSITLKGYEYNKETKKFERK